MVKHKFLYIASISILLFIFLVLTAAKPMYGINCPTDTPIRTITPTNTIIPTNIPTETPINTPTETFVPINTPTYTSTNTEVPTSTSTDMPIDTPTYIYPTSTISPTQMADPTSTAISDPTFTATVIYPTDTVMPTAIPDPIYTVTPYPTSTPNILDATSTPYPPYPAFYSINQKYPGKIMGVMVMGGINYRLYNGVKAANGALLLPGGINRGAAFYLNTIWVHRIWKDDWLRISKGSEITIISNGHTYIYIVSGRTFQPYGKYFGTEGIYIASCYSNEGKWMGIELYQLKLVSIYSPRPHNYR